MSYTIATNDATVHVQRCKAKNAVHVFKWYRGHVRCLGVRPRLGLDAAGYSAGSELKGRDL